MPREDVGSGLERAVKRCLRLMMGGGRRRRNRMFQKTTKTGGAGGIVFKLSNRF